MKEQQQFLAASRRRRKQIIVMLAQGKSQADIAKHFGVSRQRINQIEKDETRKGNIEQ